MCHSSAAKNTGSQVNLNLFRTVKKETEGIVILLCDLFEYSEEERLVLMQAKSKKFFGLI